MKPNSKINSQNDAASSQSSINSNLIYPLTLDSRDQTKLDSIYDEISKSIFELRNNKIILLEKYNHILSYRSVLQQKIKVLQKQKARKIEEERMNSELILQQQLQKRENARKKLREAIQFYKKANNQNPEIDLTKPKMYFTLVQERINIQEKNFQIQQQIAKQSVDLSSQNLIDQISGLKAKKNELINSTSKNKLLNFSNKLKNMNISQIKTLLDTLSCTQKRNQLQNLLNQCKWQQESTKDIQRFIEEQNQEKINLFQQVFQLKLNMQQMQKSCQSIQALQYDSRE